jgi:hypothetical protein
MFVFGIITLNITLCTYIIICLQFKLLNLLMVEVGLGKMIGVVINYLKKIRNSNKICSIIN